MSSSRNPLRVPHCVSGLLLIAVCWPLNWLLPEAGRPAAYFFFPLWVGYALVVDALVLSRSGTSMLTRSRWSFVWLFIASAPTWWLFEAINRRTGNWEYLGAEIFGPTQYFLLCTVAFSTVMPAVFGTAELVRGTRWIERFARGPRLPPVRRLPIWLLLTGLLMLTLTLLWPRWFYPLVWCSVFLLLEPLNIWLDRPHLIGTLQRGDWRPVIALGLGSLVCGFFWEMWNFYSYPKWIYHTPGVEFLYLFEMPLLGYLGYIPFAWELHSLRNLLFPRAAAPRLTPTP